MNESRGIYFAMGEDYILQMKNITKKFPGVIALNNVSFDLKQGEVHILMGENGAGKSTLIKILSGSYLADEGEIFIKGKKELIKEPKDAQDLGIASIYQELNLLPELSIAENVFLGHEILTSKGFINWPETYKKTNKLLKEFLDVEIDSRTLIKYLSISQQQIMEIIKAVFLNKKIYIMDEPTSALTKSEVDRLFKLIRKLTKQGKSVIYISHRLSEFGSIGDRVTVLRNGKKIGTYLVKDVDEKFLVQKMIGKKMGKQFPTIDFKIGEEIIRIEGISRQPVLKSVSFSIREGEILGIFGLMGAGRTELLRAIFGADPIDSGKVYIRGVEKTIKSPFDAIISGIGLIPEDRKAQGLILGLSVKDNISVVSLSKMANKWGFINGNIELKKIKEVIDCLEIKTPGYEQEVQYLSGGNQQKVVISKWLLQSSDVLFFDMPTRGIDVGAKREIYNLMVELIKGGKGIILVSDELPEILNMSYRIIVLSSGEITGSFNREEANAEKLMECTEVHVK